MKGAGGSAETEIVLDEAEIGKVRPIEEEITERGTSVSSYIWLDSIERPIATRTGKRR